MEAMPTPASIEVTLTTGAVSVEYEIEELTTFAKGYIDKVVEGCTPYLAIAVCNPIINIPYARLDVVDKLSKLALCGGVVVDK